jgi:hypothetical protein
VPRNFFWDKLVSSDAGRFRDYLFERGMASSSVKRIFSTVRAIMNLVIREQGLDRSNVFSGTFIPADTRTTKKKANSLRSTDKDTTRMLRSR